MRRIWDTLSRRPIATSFIAIVVVALLASEAVAQRRGGGGGRMAARGTDWMYDGSYIFCRIAFNNSFRGGDGGGWTVDYPRADLNFPFRLGQLTKAPISRDLRGEPNHVVVTLVDPHLFQCPFVMMTEPGGADLGPDEAAKLREYIDKGGFLWADDFWGEYAWDWWEREIRKAFPEGEFPIIDLPMTHPLFHMQYVIDHVPQIPSANSWFRNGFSTSERGDSQVPHARAIVNADGNIVVLMTHNTDFGDAFEREGDSREYFERFAAEGYGFGVNVYLYAMTH